MTKPLFCSSFNRIALITWEKYSLWSSAQLIRCWVAIGHCTFGFRTRVQQIDPRVKFSYRWSPIVYTIPQTTGPDECFQDQFDTFIDVTSFGDVMTHAPFVTQKPFLEATFRVCWNRQPLVLIVDVSSLWLLPKFDLSKSWWVWHSVWEGNFWPMANKFVTRLLPSQTIVWEGIGFGRFVCG